MSDDSFGSSSDGGFAPEECEKPILHLQTIEEDDEAFGHQDTMELKSMTTQQEHAIDTALEQEEFKAGTTGYFYEFDDTPTMPLLHGSSSESLPGLESHKFPVRVWFCIFKFLPLHMALSDLTSLNRASRQALLAQNY